MKLPASLMLDRPEIEIEIGMRKLILLISGIASIARLVSITVTPGCSPIPLESRFISSFVGSRLCRTLKAFSHALTDALTVGRSITAASYIVE